jgi:hypothetical protein
LSANHQGLPQPISTVETSAHKRICSIRGYYDSFILRGGNSVIFEPQKIRAPKNTMQIYKIIRNNKRKKRKRLEDMQKMHNFAAS